ncbi:unnamed protein product [Nezara viridula]|uniref:Dynein intermediate chain 3, ciliary n=1 Tax=Nezara viridula TaxID=85310 RepID=A0A9P0GZ04_NEZVI|nr:unnamed protein product [Nezara viridula]
MEDIDAIEDVEGDPHEDEEQLKYRIDTAFSYVKTRNCFGRPTSHFKAIGPVSVLEKKPDMALKQSFLKRYPVPRSCQTDFGYSIHDLLTFKINYFEATIGPKSKDDFDTESATRMRKKMMKEETLLQNMPAIQRKAERCCMQSSAINIYENYFEPPTWDEPEEYAVIELRKIDKYEDFIDAPPRPVQSIAIEPFDGLEMAAAYSYLTYRKRDFITDCQCYIWNFEDTTKPLMTLEPTVPVTRLNYNPKLPQMLLGGLMTGQLCYWDLRASTTPAAFSGLHTTFREPPSGALWVHSKTGFDCFATSPDGQVIWYDVRYFDKPIESLILDFHAKDQAPSLANTVGVSTLEFEPTIPTRFMLGLETGNVLIGNRKGKTLQEKFSQPYYAFPAPVKSLVRNPSNLKCFLCVGGYQFKIFAEDCKESYIFWSQSHNCWLTAGTWSPTKHSVFYITRKDGYFDVWDLLQNVEKPVLSEELSTKPLRCCQVHESGKHIAAAGDDGTITLVEVSSHFYAQDKNERSLIAAMLERESKREKLIDARNREVKLQQRQREQLESMIVTETPDEKLKQRAREAFIKSLNAYDAKKHKQDHEGEEMEN